MLGSIFSFDSHSTTWGKSEVSDPIIEGKTCSVQEPMSSGSYIYHWPSKYDLVFWPLTDQNGIWYCLESGFIAFMGDFEDLSEQEIKRIAQYLGENKNRVLSETSKLELLENIYALRDKEQIFKNRLLRVLAYLYEEADEIVLANEYREKALSDIEQVLKRDIGEYNKLEYLYLAANYHRQLARTKESDIYISRLEEAIDNLKDQELKGFAEYLTELLKATKDISAGGILRPALPEKDV